MTYKQNDDLLEPKGIRETVQAIYTEVKQQRKDFATYQLTHIGECDAHKKWTAGIQKRVGTIEKFLISVTAVALFLGWLIDRPAIATYFAKRIVAAQMEEPNVQTHHAVASPARPVHTARP